jgi:alpha-tubulin suppressor-like RCC1 family protein
MPNFSGVWNLKEQIQAIAAGRWTGLPGPELYTWGNNAYGRLGNDTTVSTSSPIQIGALSDWSQVSAGYQHTAAINDSGELYAWGFENAQGRLGDGTISRQV